MAARAGAARDRVLKAESGARSWSIRSALDRVRLATVTALAAAGEGQEGGTGGAAGSQKKGRNAGGNS